MQPFRVQWEGVSLVQAQAGGIDENIALRRKGFTKTGFFIQLVGPVFFALYIILESILY